MMAPDAAGLDPGSYKTVLAAISGKGIDIVLSESSAKSTPTVTAYTDAERVIGDSAKTQMKKNFKNTLQYFTRFMGLNVDCVAQMTEEKLYMTNKIVPLENKKFGFELVCRGTKLI